MKITKDFGIESLKFDNAEEFIKFSSEHFKNQVIVKAKAHTATKEDIKELQKKNSSIEVGEIYLEFETYDGEHVLLSYKDLFRISENASEGFVSPRKPPGNVVGVQLN